MRNLHRPSLAESTEGSPLLSRMVDNVRWSTYQVAKGGVQTTADVLGFGLEAAGYIAGTAVRSGISGINEAAKGVLGKKTGQPWSGSKA